MQIWDTSILGKDQLLKSSYSSPKNGLQIAVVWFSVFGRFSTRFDFEGLEFVGPASKVIYSHLETARVLKDLEELESWPIQLVVS